MDAEKTKPKMGAETNFGRDGQRSTSAQEGVKKVGNVASDRENKTEDEKRRRR